MAKRLSVRAAATRCGIPAGVVTRAVESGELRAVVVVTETGKRRSYIHPDDVDAWIVTLSNDSRQENRSSARKQG